MPEIKFDVSGDTIDRLFILKEQQGKRNLTGNEFAAELLEEVLRERVPHLPSSGENKTAHVHTTTANTSAK